MTLEEKVNEGIKTAMKAKDQAALRGMRAIKSAILLFKTDGSGTTLDFEGEIKILQKLIKQRRDSLDIFEKQGREDLAAVEREEIAIIEKLLPTQMSSEELTEALKTIIAEMGATSVKDMGKVIAAASKQLVGRADGKAISTAVKSLL